MYERNRKNLPPKYIQGLLFGFKRIISLLFVRATLGCQEWLQYYTDREGCVALSMVQLSGSHLREMIVVTLVSCDKTITVSGSAGGGKAARRRAQVTGDILACSGSVTSSGARDGRGNRNWEWELKDKKAETMLFGRLRNILFV